MLDKFLNIENRKWVPGFFLIILLNLNLTWLFLYNDCERKKNEYFIISPGLQFNGKLKTLNNIRKKQLIRNKFQVNLGF